MTTKMKENKMKVILTVTLISTGAIYAGFEFPD